LPSGGKELERQEYDFVRGNDRFLEAEKQPIKNQIPRCKQRGIKLATLQSSGVFDPRGIRQLAVQARPLGSLLAGIKALLETINKI
jgi:hypothetical protein